jgi:SAM-dependent methyltransferase
VTLPENTFDPAEMHDAMLRRLQRRAVASGDITIPAVPGMVDVYVDMCLRIFAGLASIFTDEQTEHLRSVLLGQAESAYSASQRSEIVIRYNSPIGVIVNYEVAAQSMTIEETYHRWIETRTPPLFGTEPDARVWALASEISDPSSSPVLDIGAGTGRNVLALARLGHPADAVEVTAKFAEAIAAAAAAESLNVRVFQRDVFSTTADLRDDYQLILLSEVVPEFRRPEQLRTLFEIAARHLGAGGRLVFNTFIFRPDLVLDEATRAVSEQMFSNLFAWDEISSAAAGLGLELVSDESVYDYEQANLPDGSWPPTGWYPAWVAGQDVYDLPREKCPNEMRWLVFQKPRPVAVASAPAAKPVASAPATKPVASAPATKPEPPAASAPATKPEPPAASDSTEREAPAKKAKTKRQSSVDDSEPEAANTPDPAAPDTEKADSGDKAEAGKHRRFKLFRKSAGTD